MRLFLSPPHQAGTEASFLREVLDSNYLAPTGPMLDRLEAAMGARLDFRHALALNSATAAIELAIRHLIDVRHDRRDPRPPLVLASTLTFIASVAPAARLGCEVRFIDAEEDSWTLDPILLAKALRDAQAEDRPVLAVIPTDLYGQACDLQAIRGLCDPTGIPVLCDAAEALGVISDLPKAWASVISFNGNKIITCSGGGILASDDAELIAHARKLSMQARENFVHYEHRELGQNYRLSNLLAAVAMAQLGVLDERIRQKRAIFEGYQARLGDLPGVRFMPEAGWNQCTRWLSALRIDEDITGLCPEDLRLALEAEDIESRPVWKPMHQQPVFQGLRCYGGEVSDAIFREGLCLPSGTAMNDADIDRVCAIIRSLF